MAQQLDNPEWFTLKLTERPYKKSDLYCTGDRAFTFGNVSYNGKKRSDAGYIYFLDGSAQPVERSVTLPMVKDHDCFNTFFVFQDSPYVMYSAWEKGTGRVTLYVQRYSRDTFDPTGSPVEVGVVPLNPKSYGGMRLDVKAHVSPDGTKMLFYFDDIQIGGVKLAMCWVVDRDLKTLWEGVYKVPVQSIGATSRVYFHDNGHVILEMKAVTLNEDNMREKRDGTTQVKVDAKYWMHSSKTWYEIHGEAFRMWDGTLAGDEVMKDGGVYFHDDQLRFAGILAAEERKGAMQEWVTGELDGMFKPVQATRGRYARQEVDDRIAAEVVVAPTGEFHLLTLVDGTLSVSRFSANGQLQWERYSAWWTGSFWDFSSNDFFFADGRLMRGVLGKRSDVETLRTGKKIGLGFNAMFMPLLVSWNAEGDQLVQPVFPDGTDSILRDSSVHGLPKFENIARCGAFLDWSYDKNRPGIVRVHVH